MAQSSPFSNPQDFPLRGSSVTVFGLEFVSLVLDKIQGCYPLAEASSSLCLAFSPSRADWGGFCGSFCSNI